MRSLLYYKLSERNPQIPRIKNHEMRDRGATGSRAGVDHKRKRKGHSGSRTGVKIEMRIDEAKACDNRTVVDGHMRVPVF